LLFTTTPPERQGVDILLYFSPEDASKGQHLYEVAVHFDGLLHRLIPLGNLDRDLDPGWTTSATYHGGGFITARGPIPSSLFAPCSGDGQRHASSQVARHLER
jgi:hypothetical protein